MAGRGFAPKARDQRRNRNTPQRGEWVDLPPLAKPVLPTAKKTWPAPVKALWTAWRQDPVSQTWGPADIAILTDTAERWLDLKDSEQRLRIDGLGLTAKGRRDLRLRLPSEQTDAQPVRPLASVTPIDIKLG